jgi:trans-aconitate methyltransferase
VAERFDAAYYQRFYGRRPVHNRRQIAALGDAVVSFASWWRLPIRSVLDVGAGKGFWRDWAAERHPSVRYHGIDASEYACRTFGHERADIAVWQPRRRYDLVVCQSVVQYLGDTDATKAISTLRAATRGLLFFDTPTIADRDNVIDTSYTDLDVHWRTGDWYRRRLSRGFTEIGAGIWLSHDCPAVFYELEHARHHHSA